MAGNSKTLSASQQEKLLELLEKRFEQHSKRHPNIQWKEVFSRIKASPEKLWSLQQMEETGGEPDVLLGNEKSGAFLFVDAAPESPAERRCLCYDDDALESRKANKPKGSSAQRAAEMGAALVTEEVYQQLQQTGNYDTKTSSWLATPEEIRERGGAIFGDRRFGRVFIYHNGAESYYGGRGFRTMIWV